MHTIPINLKNLAIKTLMVGEFCFDKYKTLNSTVVEIGS